MRAISFDTEQAERIASGAAAVFSRKYRTPYRGLLAVHEKGHQIVAVGRLVNVADQTEPWWRDSHPQSVESAIAKAESAGDLDERWVHVLVDIRRVAPVPCVGKGGGAWEVPAAVAELLV